MLNAPVDHPGGRNFMDSPSLYPRISGMLLLCVSAMSIWLFVNESGSAVSESDPMDCPATITIAAAMPNETVVQQIRLHNTAATPIEVLEIYSSCSCTEPRLSSHVIPPDGIVELNIKVAVDKNAAVRSVVHVVYHLEGRSNVFSRAIRIRTRDDAT